MRSPAATRLRDALHVARRRNASDLHLDAGSQPALRVDGLLEALAGPPFSADELGEVAHALIPTEQAARLETDGDVSTAWCDPDLGTMRVHVYRGALGTTIAIRLFGSHIPALASLRLPGAVTELAKRERGLAIVAGPTGSGKSTTLAALVEHINETSARRIVTIEDPIEYRHRNRRSVVTQREIGRDTPSLDSALRGVLRADPDVIVVGEIRDAEAIRGALTAAETGHLVLTTLHTGDAPQTIDRIVDAFSGTLQAQVRAQLAQVLAAVVCQHLVRRSGGSGRRAAVELLVATDAVRNMIRESKVHQLRNAIATGREAGMQTLEQHLGALLRNREIDPEEALRLGVSIGEQTPSAGLYI